jgi:hypothetical protein
MRNETTGEPHRSYELLYELNNLPLDEIEADAKAAREEMLAVKNDEEWKQ